jgi:hypothetical protein
MVINLSLVGLAIAPKDMAPMAELRPLFAPMVLSSAHLQQEKQVVVV